MANFNDFKNYALGKVWDTNGNLSSAPVDWDGSRSLAGQCVSLIKTYLKYLGYPLKAYGNAIDFWIGRSYNGILSVCDVVTTPQNGDIVVSAGSDLRYGHIFIYCDGQALSQNVCGDARALLWPLSYQGAIQGYLRPKCLNSSATYQEKNLVKEHALATMTTAGVAIRLEDPVNGKVTARAFPGFQQEYTEKWVGNGHRYISWIAWQGEYKNKRLFMAVSGSESHGQAPWATFGSIPNPHYKD